MFCRLNIFTWQQRLGVISFSADAWPSCVFWRHSSINKSDPDGAADVFLISLKVPNPLSLQRLRNSELCAAAQKKVSRRSRSRRVDVPAEELLFVEFFLSSSQKSLLQDVTMASEDFRVCSKLFSAQRFMGEHKGGVWGSTTSSEGSLKSSFYFLDEVQILVGRIDDFFVSLLMLNWVYG